jgi:hypothetical protein
LGCGALLVTLPGTVCNPDPGPSPCELDRLGCVDPEPSGDFYLASCPSELGGALAVEVGTGEAGFEAFAPGAGPFVHFGPQGGQHVFMGFRVLNARLDVSPRLRLRFYLGQGEGCLPPASGTALPACAVTLGERELVLGGTGFTLRADAAGAVEEYGLVVFVAVPDRSLPGLVALSVEDQCRRSGADFQIWTRYE